MQIPVNQSRQGGIFYFLAGHTERIRGVEGGLFGQFCGYEPGVNGAVGQLVAVLVGDGKSGMGDAERLLQEV